MITISLCMIIKDEEATLSRCLESVRSVVDEIIIVDTGSTDGSLEIAKRFTDKVLSFEWVDNFASARNFSFSAATMDYILWLDADDVILEDDLQKLRELKENLSDDIKCVMLKYNTGFDDSGNVTFSFYRERLVKRGQGFLWKEPVHEYIETSGKTIYTEIAVTHKKLKKPQAGRNLRIYENLLKSGETLSPRGRYYYARELKDSGRWSEAIDSFTEFLDGKKGWIEDNISSLHAISDCYQMLREDDKIIEPLLKTLAYDAPRPETCCRIGYYFKKTHSYKNAIFWFELALLRAKTYKPAGFCNVDYLGYIPSIELAVCYSVLGENQIASQYNEKAVEYKPNCSAVLSNRKYFEKLL